jgi:hypothetical protein
MARRRKEDGRMGRASRGMVRRWGRFFSRVRHWGVPDRCHASGVAVDVCSDAPAWAQRAERAADGGVVSFREPSLCRQEHRELLRSVLLDLTPIISTTACHQRNDVERYSRSNDRCLYDVQSQQQAPRGAHPRCDKLYGSRRRGNAIGY